MLVRPLIKLFRKHPRELRREPCAHERAEGTLRPLPGVAYLVVHELKRQGRLANPSTANHDHLVEGQGALALTLVCSHPAGLLRVRHTTEDPVEELPMRRTHTERRSGFDPTEIPALQQSPVQNSQGDSWLQAERKPALTLQVVQHSRARAGLGMGQCHGRRGDNLPQNIHTASALPPPWMAPSPRALPYLPQVIWNHRHRDGDLRSVRAPPSHHTAHTALRLEAWTLSDRREYMYFFYNTYPFMTHDRVKRRTK